MTHLFLGIDPRNLALSPFIPCCRKRITLKGSELALPMHPEGDVSVLPNISTYLGSDILSVILTTGMHTQEGYSLAVDIGTNAEIDARRENSPPGGVITLSKSLLHIRQQNYKNEGRGKNPSPCFHALRRCLVKAGSHVAARSSCGTARGLSPPARRETA